MTLPQFECRDRRSLRLILHTYHGDEDIEAAASPGQLMDYLLELSSDEGKITRFGSISTAVYDTAWLSMAHHPQDPTIWCFLECFEALLELQEEDGTWSSTTSQMDGIINTLAALLGLVFRHRASKDESLLPRIGDAKFGVQALLKAWKVEACVHVGFELLVPSLLHQLIKDDMHFSFPGQDRLMQLNEQKLQKFQLEMVYSKHQTMIEAFVGLVDFDLVRHHCAEEYWILGSPAATVAYLANVSEWDHRAERYLQMLPRKDGAVPSAHPTCIFEISWVSTARSYVSRSHPRR